MTAPEVIGFYHEATGSIAYLVIDPATKQAAASPPPAAPAAPAPTAAAPAATPAPAKAG